MKGNFFTRSAAAFGSLASHPDLIGSYFSKSIAAATPIELRLPWFSWTAIQHLRQKIGPQQQILEWGGGGSSLFFVDLRANLLTIETDPDWHQKLAETKSQLPEESRGRWNLMKLSEPTEAQSRQNYLAPATNTAWDYVIVDGPENKIFSRMDCVQKLSELPIKPHAIILDDAWREEYSEAPHILANYDRHIFRSVGPARLGVTQTDIYYRK
ncbi:MAG: hypothetical protein NTX13_03290 [Acidobacteria bacterium]|nr:hypothetical protein [Acidobacteriota bacterium]